MTNVLLMAAAMPALAAAAYVWIHLPDHTAGAARVWLARLVLGAVGLGLGAVWTRFVVEPLSATLAFLAGFGVAHVPAAAILLLKRLRGAGRS